MGNNCECEAPTENNPRDRLRNQENALPERKQTKLEVSHLRSRGPLLQKNGDVVMPLEYQPQIELSKKREVHVSVGLVEDRPVEAFSLPKQILSSPKILRTFSNEYNTQSEKNGVQEGMKGRTEQKLMALVHSRVEINPFLVYTGTTTLENKFHENGKLTWKDGSQLTAKFRQGKICSEKPLNMHFADGSRYQGQARDKKANGMGRLEMKDNTYYQGQWMNDLPHGFGKHSLADGSFYQGNFVDGFKSGKGKFFFQYGKYQGEFQRDQFHGKGFLALSDGRLFQGIWVKGIFQDKGELSYPNGDRYVGQFKNYLKHGRGVYYYRDGREWDGQWANGKQHGFGTYSGENGTLITNGQWKNGKHFKEEASKSPIRNIVI